MTQTGLSECYWAEAVATAANLRNRLLTRSMKNKTPYEKWFDRKPDLSQVRVFGCMHYAYILEVNKRRKLSNKAEKLCFIAYSLQAKSGIICLMREHLRFLLIGMLFYTNMILSMAIAKQKALMK